MNFNIKGCPRAAFFDLLLSDYNFIVSENGCPEGDSKRVFKPVGTFYRKGANKSVQFCGEYPEPLRICR